VPTLFVNGLSLHTHSVNLSTSSFCLGLHVCSMPLVSLCVSVPIILTGTLITTIEYVLIY
jgi:hypothetical protein